MMITPNDKTKTTGR